MSRDKLNEMTANGPAVGLPAVPGTSLRGAKEFVDFRGNILLLKAKNLGSFFVRISTKVHLKASLQSV